MTEDYELGSVVMHFGGQRQGLTPSQIDQVTAANPLLVEQIGKAMRPSIEATLKVVTEYLAWEKGQP